jgi:hypothetical protein
MMVGTDIVIYLLSNLTIKLLRCTCIFLFGLSQLYMMEHVPVGITAFREVLIFGRMSLRLTVIRGGK